MTADCREVLDKCGFEFTVDNIRAVEEMLVRTTAGRLISLIQNKDKDGEHGDAVWFMPWIKSGYIKGRTMEPVTFDEAFWKCYEAMDLLCDDMRPFHFMAIDQLKDRLEDVIDCANRARIRSVPFIAAMVRNDRHTERKIENNADKLLDVTGSSGIQKRELADGYRRGTV